MRTDIEIPFAGGGHLNGALARGKRLRDHLQKLGIEHDVEIHDQAGHGFMTEGSHPIGKLVFLPMRLGYASAPGADAWQRVYAFFDRHLNQA